MYRDAKEELQRLEDALLSEEEQDAVSSFDVDIDEDEPEEPQPANRDWVTVCLTAVAFTLAAASVGVLLFWLIRYRSVFL